MQGDRDHSFEAVSAAPAYRELNRSQLAAFLRELDLPPPWVAADVACGVGLMTVLGAEIAAGLGATIAQSVGVDLDREALLRARARLRAALPGTGGGAAPAVGLLQGPGQRLALGPARASYVTVGNSIHNFAAADKAALLAEAHRVLRPGGALFFNSSFYDGAVIAGTERYWVDNVRGALRQIVRAGTRPSEGEAHKPDAIRFLTPPDYAALARDAGFERITLRESELRFDQTLMEALCAYGPYAEGALHFRYPAAVACPAMVQAARALYTDPDWARRYPGLSQGGRPYIPRRVLGVTARKPGASGAG
jgi:ubiquinone/menaquinone biosynthesis C-methylase UbiE